MLGDWAVLVNSAEQSFFEWYDVGFHFDASVDLRLAEVFYFTERESKGGVLSLLKFSSLGLPQEVNVTSWFGMPPDASGIP